MMLNKTVRMSKTAMASKAARVSKTVSIAARTASSLAIVGAVLFAALAAGDEGPKVHHQLAVELDPAARMLRATDRLTLPENLAGQPVELVLNAALKITASSEPIIEMELGDVEPFVGNNGSSAGLGTDLVRYRFLAAPDGGVFSMDYEGAFHFGLGDPKEEYSRGFRETAGIVGEEGVYLAGSGFWVPTFGTGLFTFELAVEAPADWHLISQGHGTSAARTAWRVGAPRSRWRRSISSAVPSRSTAIKRARSRPWSICVSRTTPWPPNISAPPLSTSRCTAVSSVLILGPSSPLVENFWETGYGMPSFTLLGPRVIRFPFILHSSYPHEILHNWWGNSVFVDYGRGNWCEGLTAYLADHLIKEQRGQGAQYRRDTLQRYSSYVRESEDFPLTQFRSRHSAATEAVGYGKTSMGFHMLRRTLGDEAFVRGLRDFYRRHRGRRASFDDLRHSFERASSEALSGRDLGRFFSDWTSRPGAPVLRLSVHDVQNENGEYRIAGRWNRLRPGLPGSSMYRW